MFAACLVSLLLGTPPENRPPDVALAPVPEPRFAADPPTTTPLTPVIPGQPPVVPQPPAPPPPPPPPNPCDGASLPAGPDIQPGKTVPIGTVLTVAIPQVQGYVLGLGICCAIPDPLGCFTRLVPRDTPFTHCAGASGTLKVILDGTDPNGCYVKKEETVTVLPPDKIEAKQSAAATGPQYRTTQYFDVTAGGDPLGPCFDTCADEKILFWGTVSKKFGVPPNMNAADLDWDPAGGSCPPKKDLVFYYVPSDGDGGGSKILDIKTGIWKSIDSAPVGGPIITYKQWAGVKHSRCEPCADPVPPDDFAQNDPCRWLTESFVFSIERTGQDEVVHQLMPNWPSGN